MLKRLMVVILLVAIFFTFPLVLVALGGGSYFGGLIASLFVWLALFVGILILCLLGLAIYEIIEWIKEGKTYDKT
jgi:uncharacterized membrane protein YdjX (TVP38/TMEM64 family)